MIQNLPFEIINIICQQLNQYDTFQLSQCSKSLNNSSIPRIYQSIIINSNKNYISKNYIPRLNKTYNNCNTIVRTSFGLKLLLKTLVNNPKYCGYIRSIETSDVIPYIPDTEIHQNLIEIFPNLKILQRLNWYSSLTFLSFECVVRLPNLCNLVNLNGNFKDFHKLLMTMTKSKLYNTTGSYLSELSVSCFNKSGNLKYINLNEFPQLKHLKISKTIESKWPALSNCSNMNSATDQDMNGLFNYNSIVLENDTLSELLDSLEHQICLKTLKLDNILINTSDSDLLKLKIDLSQLCKLSIIRSSEFMNMLSTSNSIFFLQKISLYLCNITELDIDFYNDFKDSTPMFITSLPRLTNINCVVRWNHTRNNTSSQSFQDLVSMYFQSFIYHQHQLTSLKIDFQFEEVRQIQPSNMKSYNIPINVLNKLSLLTHLTRLRVPIIELNIPDILQIFKNLPHLEIVELVFATSCANLIPDYNNTICFDSLMGPFNCNSSYSYKTGRNVKNQYINYVQDFKLVLPDLEYIKIGGYAFWCGGGGGLSGLIESVDNICSFDEFFSSGK